MKQLATQIQKQGFTYDLVVRSKFNAIHSQKCNESGQLVAFEVCRINKNEERTIAGVVIPASESLPSNEQFGISGWTYSLAGTTEAAALGRAIVKFQELENQQAERERLKQQQTINQ